MRTITVRMPGAALADVDRVRGSMPRERWLRELCAAAVKAHGAMSGPGVLRIVGDGVDVEAVEAPPEKRRVKGVLGVPRDLPPDPNAPPVPEQITLEEVLNG